MYGTPEGTIHKWNRKEILEDVTQETPLQHDKHQLSEPIEYTQELIKSREDNLWDLSRTIKKHIGPYFKGKDVLELGPGIDDILYEILLPSFDGNAPSWNAIDIHPGIINRLSKKYASFKNYESIQGTIRDIPLKNDQFDIVCGMAALDSIIDIDKVTEEIHRVLKPGGYLIHIQDLPPSPTTLLQLLAKDPQLPENEDVLLYDLRLDGYGGVTHIEFPGGVCIETHMYMHNILEREFEKRGFTPTSKGLRKYSENLFEIYSTANIILDDDGKTLSNNDIFPHYSFLIMQKK